MPFWSVCLLGSLLLLDLLVAGTAAAMAVVEGAAVAVRTEGSVWFTTAALVLSPPSPTPRPMGSTA